MASGGRRFGARYCRARAIGAKDVARFEVLPGDAEAVAVALRARKPRGVSDAHAGAQCLLGEPAQQVGGIGGQEEAAGREQIDMAEAGRVQPHPVNAPRQRMRQVDLLGRLLDQDAGGGDACPGLGLGLQHHDIEPAHGRRAGRHQAGEARADDEQIAALRVGRHRVPRKSVLV
jgi:hypothetical protein